MDLNPHLGSKDDVIRSHMGLARAVAKRFRWAVSRAPHIDFQDIVSEACIGLMKAYERFDGSRGVKFSSYAEPWVYGEIRDFIRRQGGAVRIPDELYRLNGRILRDELQGSSPTEVSSVLSCSESRAKLALQSLRQFSSDSLDRPLASNDGDEDRILLDSIGQSQDQSGINVREFLSVLDPDERHYVQVRSAGDQTEQPILLKSVQTKLAAYMELSESEVEKMSHELTKEKYQELKKQGLSDRDIYSKFSMSETHFYKQKGNWGLTQKKGTKKTSTSKSVKPLASNTVDTKHKPAEPIIQEDWKARYDNITQVLSDRASIERKQIERLETEVRLLKEMLKFYL
jgi:RNA polymerase sporulation-specific sigma factor